MCHAEEKVKRKASKKHFYKLRINCMKHQKAIIVRHFAVKCRGNLEHDVAENFNAWV